ncbi:MAG: hypothetical protein QXX94_07235 [Candidatus Bathyarchaeia archaeon]
MPLKIAHSNSWRRKEKIHGGFRRWLPIFHILFILLLIFILTSLFYRWFLENKGSSQKGSSVDLFKAAIVDGIGLTRPNSIFIKNVKGILENAGLSVDVYAGENVTIDLLGKIGGYGLLILRLHSAIDTTHRFLYLFSAERFNRTEYETRFSNILGVEPTAIREGKTFENESYFALRADLLGYMNYGGLNGSTIILMGCNGTNSDHAIDRLFEKGVKAIIAWDGYVDLNYTDKITSELIKAIYEEGYDPNDAVRKVMEDYGPDPVYKSELKYLANPS